MAGEGGIPPAFLPWSLEHIHAALVDEGFLEAFYRHYASIDSPKRSPWTHERHVPGAGLHKSCRLAYVAKSAAALWYMYNTTGAKQPNETVDSLEMGYCPSMARLTLTATTDMLVMDGGPQVQAVRMWTKQWTFTAAGSEDGTPGCTVFGTAKAQGATLTAALRQVDGLVSLLKDHMAELAAHGKLVSQLEAQALMTEPGPSSPQGSAGGPGTPQNISQPSRDFLRADVTPLEDMTPLNVNPTSVIIRPPVGKPEPHDARLSASDYEALRIGQRPQQLPPHVKASEAARVLNVAKPRMSPVWEEKPMPAPGVAPICKAVQSPVRTKGATELSDIKVQPAAVELARNSPVSVIFEPVQGTSEPGSPESAERRASAIPSPSRIRISLSSEGRRSISQEPPKAPLSPSALSGPLHFRTSYEDVAGAGQTFYDPAGSISGGHFHPDAVPPQLPRIAIGPGSSALPHGFTYPALSPQMGPFTTDPAQALTTMMEVAIETVNTVAQIAVETVQKMSAVTMEQLSAADQQGDQHRMRPVPHMQPLAASPSCMQRAQRHTGYHDTSATDSDLGAKLWDVRTSQKGSPRQAFSDCLSDSFDGHKSITGSTAFHPSDLRQEDDAFIHGQTPAQSPQYRRIRLAAPMQSRPAAVPRLWQGPSPFEYRGLETESFEETPRGSPSAAPEQAQHAQQPAQDRSVPQIPSKAPPLLKRNVEKAATAQQAKHTPAAMQPKKVSEGITPAETGIVTSDMVPANSVAQESSAVPDEPAVSKTAAEEPDAKPSKLRKFCNAFTLGRAQQAGSKKSAGKKQ